MIRSDQETPAGPPDDVDGAVLETVAEIERAVARGELSLAESDRLLESLVAAAESARTATIEHARAASEHAAIGATIAIAIAVAMVGYVAYRWLQMFGII